MILVTGTTGLTGSAVVRQFVRAGTPARAMVRDPAKPRLWAGGSGIAPVVADLLVPSTLPQALEGVDTLVLISGGDNSMVEAQGNLIDAAAAAGVQHVVKVSGMGQDLDSVFRFARYHARIEDHLMGSGMGWTLLRPSQFMQVYFREVPTMTADGTFAQPLGDTRLAAIDVEDVAKVAHAIAVQPHRSSRAYEMTGPEALTMTEVCDVLTRVVGRTVTYVDIDPKEKLERLVAAGIPRQFAEDIDDLFRMRREGGPESTVNVGVFEELGIRPTTFEEFARREAAVFRGDATPDRRWAAGWESAPPTR